MTFLFLKPCLDAARVYEEPSEVYSELSFRVPCDQPIYSRGVRLEDAFFELWSPNFNGINFYAGPPVAQDPLPAYNQPHTYYDGRLRPQDWSLHPQHFSSNSPWLGFCRHPQYKLTDWQSVDPKLVPLTLVWVPHSSDLRQGTLHAGYLVKLASRTRELLRKMDRTYVIDAMDKPSKCVLDHRPCFPNEQTLDDIAYRNTSLWNWEDLVDSLTAVQRGLREMEAWLTMARHWRCHYCVSTSIPLVADRECIEVWLNGASKDYGLWLLRIGVIPVYIIHLMVKDLDYPSQPRSNVTSNATLLSKLCQGYMGADHQLRRWKPLLSGPCHEWSITGASLFSGPNRKGRSNEVCREILCMV